KGTKPEGGGAGSTKAAGKGGGDVPAAVAVPAAAQEDELVISAPVHCDGCARKLRRSLQRIDGVGEVSVDHTTNTVVVRGRKAAENAAEAVRIVEKRTGRKAVLVSPAPENLPAPAVKKGQDTKKDGGNKDMNDLLEIDMKMVVVLRINLHCDACCDEIKRRILRIKGVEDAVPHLKSSQMMVKGVVEPATLVGFIHDRTGRKAAIVRAEPLESLPPAPKSPPPAEAETKKGGPAEDTGDKKNGQEKKEEPPKEEGKVDENTKSKKPSGGDGAGAAEEEEAHGGGEAADKDGAGDGVVLENQKKDDRLFTVPLPAGVVTVAPEVALDNATPYHYPYPSYPYGHIYYTYPYQYPQPYPPPYGCGGGLYGYPHYPPEAFSEENPNACAIV
ncbi:hypothetical protein BAE44_0014645, partial [Dichanthelium oligosanthes]